MIEQLFGSKTRVKLLHLFYNNANRSFYVREITRKINEQINSVRRELANLLSIGIIKSDSASNRLYYEVNQKFKHYEALRHIFTDVGIKKEQVVAKSGGDLTDRFSKIGSVGLVLLTGSLVRDPAAPIDVLVVGDVNRKKLAQLVGQLEAEEGRELRYTVMDEDDFNYRMDLSDRFLSTVMEAKHTVIIGDLLETKTKADQPKTKAKAR